MDMVRVYDLAIQIEQKVSQLYARFSTLFGNDLQTRRFWTQLAYHEKAHAEALMRRKGSLLGVRPSAAENGKVRNAPSVDSAELEAIFVKVREHERTIRKERPTLQEALAMMMEIESGEIHQIYSRLVQFSGTAPASAWEHALMIKDFLSRTPAGTSLIPQGASLLGKAGAVPEPPRVPRKPEAARTKAPEPGTDPFRAGKIKEVEPAMGYGLIEGEDGRRYLYLLGGAGHEIPEAELLIPGREVRFAWKEFSWGPRALRIRGG